MGEKSETTAPAVVATEEVVAAPAAEKPTSTAAVKETLSVPEAEPENPSAAVVEAEAEKPKEEAGETAAEEKITESASFKEESNVAGELPDPEKKALDELKLLIQEALNKHEFTAPPPPPPVKEEEKPAEAPAAETEVEKIVEKSEAPAETPAVETTPAAAAPPPPVETKAEEKESTPPPPPPAAEPSEEKAATPPPPPPAVEPSSEKAATPPPPPPAAEPSSVTTVVDEDGAKTVEAIKETIIEVPAAAAVPLPEEAPPAEPAAAAVSEEAPAAAAPPPPPEEVSIWGIRLLADEKSDVVLLKFLRARDFKVKDAFTMIKNTVRWQKEFGIEALLEEEEEEFGAELEKVVFMSGFDKEGHPVCYNAYGEFQNKELYQKIFADEEKREKFLGWRIRFLEKSIRKLDFSPDGISTIVQVNDLKNSPGPFKRELRLATNQALQLLQDNYPEFVAKQVY